MPFGHPRCAQNQALSTHTDMGCACGASSPAAEVLWGFIEMLLHYLISARPFADMKAAMCHT